MSIMERSLTMELVRVTEAAALSSARWVGKGNKNDADDAATSAMRTVVDTIPMQGKVVIGEGEMVEAPMLYIGEELGTGDGPEVDIAVDPLEGANSVAGHSWTDLSVVIISDGSNLLHAPDMYMNKIAVGPEAVSKIDINDTVAKNINNVAKAKNKAVEDILAVVLSRPRHEELIAEIRATGARIKLIQDGDVAGAINTAFDDTGVDILFGIGGAPEAVLSAAALQCLGGEIQGKLTPSNEEEARRCKEMGIEDLDYVYKMNDFCKGDDVIFAATGVTDGELLKGVQFKGDRATTETVVMRAKSGTIRFVAGSHSLKKKPNLVMDAE